MTVLFAPKTYKRIIEAMFIPKDLHGIKWSETISKNGRGIIEPIWEFIYGK